MKHQPEDQLEIREPLKVECPFCLFGHYVVDVAEGAEPSVLHSMPPCKTFLDTEIDEFLVMARHRLMLGTFDDA